jgi:hypothetical protein
MTVWAVTCDGEDAAFRADSDDGAPTIEVSPITCDRWWCSGVRQAAGRARVGEEEEEEGGWTDERGSSVRERRKKEQRGHAVPLLQDRVTLISIFSPAGFQAISVHGLTEINSRVDSFVPIQ